MATPTDEQIVMGFEAMRLCLGQPTKLRPHQIIDWMVAHTPCQHVYTWTPSGPSDRCRNCGAPRPVTVVPAPKLTDLMPTEEEQEQFERLIRWQQESMRSLTRLGELRYETTNDSREQPEAPTPVA